MPYNSVDNIFDINGLFENIGEATGEWKEKRESYEHVQGILVDINYLIHHYVGNHKTKIMELADSILGKIGNAVCVIFAPLGFGNAQAAVATVMGLVAKEEIVGVFGVLGFAGMTRLAAYSFLIFNLLCAPCFAAMGAIKREMNNGKWTAFAIGYQCVFAYCVSLAVYQIGSAICGSVNIPGLIAAAAVVLFAMFMLLRRPSAKK